MPLSSGLNHTSFQEPGSKLKGDEQKRLHGILIKSRGYKAVYKKS